MDDQGVKSRLVSDQNKPVRHRNPTVAIECISHSNGIFIVATDHWAAAAVISVTQRYAENERLQLDHHQGLDQIAIDSIAHPGTPGFDLQTTLPDIVVRVDFVSY